MCLSSAIIQSTMQTKPNEKNFTENKLRIKNLIFNMVLDDLFSSQILKLRININNAKNVECVF